MTRIEKKAFTRDCPAFHKAMRDMHLRMVGPIGIRMDSDTWTKKERDAKESIALEYAFFMHLGQKDKGGKDYIEHPIRVAECVATTPEKIVAFLHDTVEDAELDISELKFHYPDNILRAIEAISRKKGEDYKTYINRVNANGLARSVKIADLNDNMSTKRWCFGSRDVSNSMWKRYSEALELLKGEHRW